MFVVLHCVLCLFFTFGVCGILSFEMTRGEGGGDIIELVTPNARGVDLFFSC